MNAKEVTLPITFALLKIIKFEFILNKPFDFHVLDRKLIEWAVPGAYDNVPIGQLAESWNAKGKQFVVGTETLEQSSLNGHFQDIACRGSTVGVFVVLINDGTCENAFDITEINI